MKWRMAARCGHLLALCLSSCSRHESQKSKAGDSAGGHLSPSAAPPGGRTFSRRRTLAEASGRGTPVLLKDAGAGFTAVWEGGEGTSPATLMAGLDGDGRPAEPSTLASGGVLPTAAEAGGQLFVAYVGEGEGERAVWLTRTALASEAREAGGR